MADVIFGPFAVLGWTLASAIFTFCAVYVWLIVWQLGGIRGTALATTCTCCAVITACFARLLVHGLWPSPTLLGAIVTAMWPPLVLSLLVQCDIYAADRNSHRSFTARSYLWYKHMTDKMRDSGSHSAFHVGDHRHV